MSQTLEQERLKRDVSEWANLPATKVFHDLIQFQINEIKKGLVSQETIMNPNGQLIMARTLGFIEGLEHILNMDLEECLQQEEDDSNE